MRAISLTTTTSCPRTTVFAYLADLTHMAEWTGVVQSCELVAGPAGEPGARYAQVLDLGGSEHESAIEVRAVEADRRLVARSRTGPITLTTTFELDDAPDGTLVRMILDPGVAGAPLAPLFRAGGETDIETLRDRLDALPAPGFSTA